MRVEQSSCQAIISNQLAFFWYNLYICIYTRRIRKILNPYICTYNVYLIQLFVSSYGAIWNVKSSHTEGGVILWFSSTKLWWSSDVPPNIFNITLTTLEFPALNIYRNISIPVSELLARIDITVLSCQDRLSYSVMQLKIVEVDIKIYSVVFTVHFIWWYYCSHRYFKSSSLQTFKWHSDVTLLYL